MARARQYYKAFEVDKPGKGFSVLSESYFHVGNKLRSLALEETDEKNKLRASRYNYGAIILYCAAVEAFLNENLAFSMFIHAEKDNDSDENRTIIKRIRILQEESLSAKKISAIFLSYTGDDLDHESQLYCDMVSLINLRHVLLHYTPEFIEDNRWPQRLQNVIRRSGAPIINTNWATALSFIEVANWVHDVAKMFIQEFCERTGARDPFSKERFMPLE